MKGEKMKTIKEMIEVMQAYEDGKEIECRRIDSHDKWGFTYPVWNWSDYDYRVKPVSKYRPYETTEELINDYIERFQQAELVFVTEAICPPIYLQWKGHFYIIEAFGECLVKIHDGWYDLEDIFEEYEFVDGSTVGKFVGME